VLSAAGDFEDDVCRTASNFCCLVLDILLLDSFKSQQLAVDADVQLQVVMACAVARCLELALQQAGAAGDGGAAGDEDTPESPWKRLGKALTVATRVQLCDGFMEMGRHERASLRLLECAAAALQLAEGGATSDAAHINLLQCAALQLANYGAQALLCAADGQPIHPGAHRPPGVGSPQLLPVTRALLRLMPQIARALRQVAGEAEGSGNQQLQHELPVVCIAAGNALQAASLPCAFSSGSEVAEWCAAAEAGLRLLPLLWQLQQAWQLQPPPCLPASGGMSGPDAATTLANACLGVWANYLHPLAIFQCGESQTPARSLQAGAAAAEPMWQLHSTACRLVHWWASLPGAAQRLETVLAGWQLSGAEVALCHTVRLAADLRKMADAAFDLAPDEPLPAAVKRCAAQLTLRQRCRKPAPRGMCIGVWGSFPSLSSPAVCALRVCSYLLSPTCCIPCHMQAATVHGGSACAGAAGGGQVGGQAVGPLCAHCWAADHSCLRPRGGTDTGAPGSV
jgi:hypothetical protein